MDTWIHKLVSAIESEGQQYNDIQHTRISSLNPENINLEILHKEPTHLTCCGPVFHTTYVPNILYNHPFNMSSELFSQILNRIATTQLVKGRDCRNFWLPSTISWSCFITVLTIAWVLSLLFGIIYPGNVGDISTVEFGIIFLSVFIVSLVSLLLACCFTHYKGKKQIREVLLDVNHKLLDHNIMVTIKHTKYKADVTEYIKTVFETDEECSLQNNHDGHSPVNVNSDEPLLGQNLETVSLRDNATALLIESSLPYLEDFIAGKLRSAGVHRHSKIVICLCQYMESKGYIKSINSHI